MKKKHMKKKQLAKLKEQFKPSKVDAQHLLFNAMKEKAAAKYNLSIDVYIDAVTSSDMVIELLDQTSRDQQIKVPLDDNFKVVVKRIQNNENGLLDRFSENLVEEVASYWVPKKETEAISTVTETKKTIKVAESATSSSSATTDFIQAMSQFPKFFVKETADQLEIFEKSAKEERLLATVSMTNEKEFSIESALERKYKLKLDVIPLIENFAALPIENRI